MFPGTEDFGRLSKNLHTFYAPTRAKWRAWLEKHHASEKEIWLIYYKKHSDKPRIPYAEAVEEALCFGWIDSTVNTIDADRFAQKFSPRKSIRGWSEPNKERAKKLIAEGKMTPAGLAKIDPSVLAEISGKPPALKIPADILKVLKKDPQTWKNFQGFSDTYKRIRIRWIDASRKRPPVFEQRLRYFIKMTKQNKTYGMMK